MNRVFFWLRHPGRTLLAGARWLRAAYLTLRHVDERQVFPAIRFTGPCGLRIKKERGSSLRIDRRLILWSHLQNRGHATIYLQEGGTMLVRDDFKLGPGTKIKVGPGGMLDIHGKGKYASSHTLGDTTVSARQHITLGAGVGTGLAVLITDSDWHEINGKLESAPVTIGENAYVGHGTTILKGTQIGDNCVMAANTTIARQTIPSRSMLAGNPARIVRSDIDWKF